MKDSTRAICRELVTRLPELLPLERDILAAVTQLCDCFAGGGKLLVCGNGGSAADSEHIVGELMKGFLLRRPISAAMQEKLECLYPEDASAMTNALQQALPAISLISQTALMTAFGNDMSAQMGMAQQVLGYGRANDILLAISTSGSSANVLYAAKMARALGVGVIGLTGESGGKLKELCDVCLCAPSSVTFRIQEYHLPIYHCICACVENEAFGEPI